VLANQNADFIYSKQPSRTGLFPTWVPGTSVALYRGPHQITKTLPAYLRTVAHAPDMQEYLIRCSNEGTDCDAPWDDAIFDLIALQPLGEVFGKHNFL
jgi:hypothetical protein